MFSSFWWQSGKKIYLDYAAVTPVDFRIVKEMVKVMKKTPANPSSLYARGVEAGKALGTIREMVAHVLSGGSVHSVHPDEIVFTSGGTESNNMAIRGVIECWWSTHKVIPHIVSTAIEHPSVKKTIEHLVEAGLATVSFIKTTPDGIIDMSEFKKVIQEAKNVALVSVMWVNNEIGTIQPLADIASCIRKYRKEHGMAYPYFHTDACQAVCYLDMQIDKVGVDMLTIDGGKIYGPRGVGCLYIKRNVQLQKMMFGGGQENDRRAGTENLPSIVGFAKALRMCREGREKECGRLHVLREFFIKNLPTGVFINGSIENRIVNNINICIPNRDAEFILFQCDVRGIELSTGTTCQTKQEDSRSYVVDSLGKNCGGSSLRISMGRWTKKSDVVKCIKILKHILSK